MPSTSTPTPCTLPALPHKITTATSPNEGYFSSQPTSSSSAASTAIAVTTPLPVATSSGSTPGSSYYPASEFPPYRQSEMLASIAARPPPPPLVLSLMRSPSESSSPSVMTFHRAPSSRAFPSLLDRPRRTPPPTQLPEMDISSSNAKYTLHVQLPITIQPEMITISAQKGDKLKVVADAWHMENDCK
jgi:hypothetical protein